MDTKTKTAEQARVSHVIQQIKQRLLSQQELLDKAHRETTLIEQNYGDNTRVNIAEADDRIETNAAVQQQKQLVARTVENESIVKSQMGQLKDLQQSPYFGRIDIEEDREKETLYIGTASFIDEQQNFLVYDWRAPISGIYYNGTLGSVSYETPMGDAKAELLKKRQFLIKDGKIETIFDTNETVGDSMLQHVLGEDNDEYMRNIVATIQQEQNDIIRDTKHDILIVQGVAGSGKTSAILQRIAFLLYHSRESLNSDQMILFSPNRLFSHYISDVLPSLGEKNMRQVTLAEFFSARFSGLHVQSLFERFEQDQRSLPKMASEIRRYKDSAAYMTQIKHYLKETQPEQLAFNPIYFEGRPFFTKTEIEQIYENLPQRMLAADKFLTTKNTLIKRLKKRIKEEARADWVLEEVDVLSDEQYHDITADHHFKPGEDEAQFIAEALVKKRLAIVYNAIYNDYFIDLYEQYADFMQSSRPKSVTPTAWKAMIAAYQDQLERHDLRLEDAAPLLYLRDRLTGSGQNHAIQYLFIDEMQDYSIAQLIYIKHAFPRCKLTLLGDRAQDLFATHYQTNDFAIELSHVFKTKSINLITLNKSYRSTYPITTFATALLPNSKDIQAFTRAGNKPELILAADQNEGRSTLTQQTSRLLTQHDTVAILTKDLPTSERLYARLKVDTPTTLITDADRALPKGILILPIYLAKGLEFDAVIAYDVSAPTFKTEIDRDILYTICSRAMHELVLIAIKEASPLIKQLDAKLFTSHGFDQLEKSPKA
ncbi:RNA polymerase recycling motor HelD [Loigolactobacillus backii]|uniref:RNA polymerase recycling motor HelD n=1 Tax=Loigolactobacillus backii TaxID=375175 RepID=UPI0007F0FBCB|nr:RNA polymerase recycling motor HelD [Loigolactobacillus backii]ANK60865.1 ATP-dependent DNA helicase [Loigolactobacillus backii]ANK65818.1 ATP-dependent DNA helicase [Loigolactobacillus backii]ANK68294.1 ATP-dependent DNA helicase [Loigolactobacillus backii]MDA5388054.1 AAA family ATPase [Loigolactobacillus backii]MDA5390561.1 AAA family ATPase [Loigolactobacillus backii]